MEIILKTTNTILVSSTLLLSAFTLFTSVAGAQTPGTIDLHFFHPEAIDPNLVLTFQNTNPLFSKASDLLNSGYPTQKGLELHSAIPGVNGGIIDITEVKICFNFSGNVIADSQTYTPAYNPWNYTITNVSNAWCVDFYIPSLLAVFPPINNNFNPGFGNQFSQSFASVTVTAQDPNGAPNPNALQAFLNQNPGNSISYTPGVFGGQTRFASDVPEPGTLAFVGSLLATGGLTFWRTRRKK